MFSYCSVDRSGSGPRTTHRLLLLFMTRFFPSPSPIRCLFSLFLFRRPHPICHVFNQLDGYAFIRLRPRAGYELDIPLDGFIAIQLAGIVLQGNLFVSFVLDIFQLLLFSLLFFWSRESSRPHLFPLFSAGSGSNQSTHKACAASSSVWKEKVVLVH